MKTTLRQALRERAPLIFDGAMGTEIYRRNFFVNACFEQLSLTNAEVIRSIHQSYCDAGAEVLTTNTFNANRKRLAKFGLADQVKAINEAGVRLARECAKEELLVAGSVGAVEVTAEGADAAVELLQEQIAALHDADFILFETLHTETKLAAVLKAMASFPEREFVTSFAVPATVNTPEKLETLLDALLLTLQNAETKPAAIGLNCGEGPEQTLQILQSLRMRKIAFPVIVQPNAGMPRNVDGRTLYMSSAEYFTTYARRYADLGAAAVGGCCGIGPEHIAELAKTLKPLRRAAVRLTRQEKAPQTPELPEKPLAERSPLGAKLAARIPVKLVEITPPRGYDLSGVVAGAKRCREAGIDAVNLPDGPRASSRISSLATAVAIQQQAGIDPIVHCCCRDRSLIGLQAELLGCAGMNIRNLLFITGDPPKLGDYPDSTGVFDVDSVMLTKLQKRMNRGLDFAGKPLPSPTSAVAGCGADPNAIDFEREVRRAHEKAAAGADYFTTQPVFSAEALRRFLRAVEDLHLPVIAGIWPLTSLRNAEFMKNEVPGVVVPDEIIRRMAQYEDKESQAAEGIRIAREIMAEIRNEVAGFQVSAPFGKVDLALQVLA